MLRIALHFASGLSSFWGTALLIVGVLWATRSARPAAAFADDLEQLLQTLARPGRAVMMLELPLLPLYNDYGRIQRRLASEFNVGLIPKRHFASVLAAPDATVDGLHLSEIGHKRMAAMIQQQLGDCLEPTHE